MTREEIVNALEEIALLLELKGENPFKIKAYTNGARALESLEEDLGDIITAKRLGEIRGIGEALCDKITKLYTTGELDYLTNLRAEIPQGMRDIARIPSLGPKKIKALHDQLGVTDIETLRQACEAGKVAALKGFGEKTQSKILDGIKYREEVGKRVRIDLAYPLGLRLLERLKALPGVIRAELCGSLRRRKETSKDIDILISSNDPAPIMKAFVEAPEVKSIIANGDTKSSIVAEMTFGRESIVMNADLRVVKDEEFPFALLYFTGSKEHNIRLRQRAIERGLTLNEYALANEKKSVPAKTEEEIYAALDLPYIAPELREDTGEIEASDAKKLPTLIVRSDLRGVFHNHTNYSDGSATLEQMALATKKLGMEYFGVGDHSQSLTVARGMSPERVLQQHEEIDQVNAKLKGVKILKGVESDILEDGSLDYDDEFLKRFDYVVASVHSGFAMAGDEMTRRICKALAHPATTMLGHATGRLILARPGYRVDLDEVLKTAAKFGKMIEINAQPMRLDLEWTYVKKAKALGIPLVINPDAHSPQDLELVEFGIDVARRGWLEAADVFNTRGLKDVMKELERRKAEKS
jgi:DNA polymerase (family X)